MTRLLRNPVHFLSLGGGLGLIPLAPGTFGTLPGFLLAALLRGWLSVPVAWAVLLLLTLVAVGCADYTARALRQKDPGSIVIDEYIAFTGLLLALPDRPVVWVWAFLCFRLFDASKPFPVSWADRHVGGGVGIVLDDVLAALLAYGLMLGLIWLQLPGGP